MNATLKQFAFYATGGWTLLALGETWDVVDFDHKVISTLVILTLSSLAFLWIKERKDK